MSQHLDRLSAEVSTMTTVASSAVALIDGLAQQIRDAGTDPAALAALADEIAATSGSLAAAVAANTVAASEPGEDQPA